MRIKFSLDYLKYTNGLTEVEVPGRTVGECVDNLLARFPQLYIHWMDNQAEEGKKSAFYLNGSFIWESTAVKVGVTETDVLEVTKSIPSGSGSIGKIIVGVVLVVVAVVAYHYELIPYAAAMIAGGMGAGLVMSGVSELILGTPSMPSFGDYGSSGSNTPTYSFSGIRNTTTVGTPLGLVYGTHRVGGQLLNIYTDVEEDSTFLYAQIGLCEGEISSIADIEINKNPLSFYNTVEIDSRLGQSTQSLMPWFTRTENSVSVGSLITNVGTTCETSKLVEAAKLTVMAPSLYHTTNTDGLLPTSVSYAIYYKESTASSFTQFESTFTMSGKTKSETLKEHLITFPAAGVYTIKVERLTEDHSSDLTYADTLYLKTINEINYDPFSYPCTAMLGVKIRATEQLSGQLPTITTVVKGQKVLVPNNYNPVTRVYSSATWDGTFAASKQWTDNPVWCLYDLLTNTRYGLGDYYRIDPAKLPIIKAQFYLMARYCDELVNGEPRFTLDMVIDSAKSAGEWLKTITSVMQANLYYSEGMLWIDINRPKPITQLFNMSNIIAGSFTQQGSSYRKIPNVYEVQWPNPERSYEYSMFRIEHMDLQRDDIIVEERKAAMNLVGVTRYTHARRLAKYALLAGRTNQKTVTFKTAANALQCMVTDVIGIQHDVPQWGYGARVISFDPTTLELVLSNDVTISDTSSYEVQLVCKGQAPKIYACTAPAGVGRSIFLGEMPDPLPEKDDIYIIGETNYSVKPFTVVSLKLADNEELEVVAVEYNASVYTAAEDLTDQVEVLVHNYSSLASPTKVSVTDFKASEKIYLANDGTVKTGIECFFTPQTNTLFWESCTIHYTIEGADVWTSAPANANGYVFLPDLQEQVVYKVVATSNYKDGSRQSILQALDDEVATPYTTVMLYGKTAPPGNVQNFVVTQNTQNNNYLKFSWKPVTDVDLSHYEIREGSDWDFGEIIKEYIKETYYNEFFLPRTGEYSFMIKAVDTSGNYSQVVATTSIYAQVEPLSVTGLIAKQVGGTIIVSWKANPEFDILGYTLKEGAGWSASMPLIENTPNTNFTITGITDRTYLFWIKAIDIYGNESEVPVSYACQVVNAPLTNIYLTFDESGDGWLGYKDGVTVDSGNLSLPALNSYDQGHTYDSGLTYDFFSVGEGHYTTGIYDLGANMNVNLIFDYVLTQGVGDVFKIELSTSDGTLATWDENAVEDGNMEWDTPFVFSYWSVFTGGYITARYFRLRLTLLNTSGSLSVAQFKTHVDVPDITQRGTNVAVPLAGVTITFPAPFFTTPSVSLTTIGTGYPRIISRTNQNFTVQVYNSNNEPIEGVIDWLANGY